MPDSLTPKQDLFVQSYLKERNATKAAVAAGYSANTAESQGSRLLRNAKVRAAVDVAIEKQAKRIQFDADRVLVELGRIALADISQAYGADGKLLSMKEMPEEVRRAIAGVETEELFEGRGEDQIQLGFVTKVKFWDKPKSLELLGKYFKLWTDKLDVSGKVTLEQLVEASRQKE